MAFPRSRAPAFKLSLHRLSHRPSRARLRTRWFVTDLTHKLRDSVVLRSHWGGKGGISLSFQGALAALHRVRPDLFLCCPVTPRPKINAVGVPKECRRKTVSRRGGSPYRSKPQSWGGEPSGGDEGSSYGLPPVDPLIVQVRRRRHRYRTLSAVRGLGVARWFPSRSCLLCGMDGSCGFWQV